MSTTSYKISDNGIIREMTSDEKAIKDAQNKAWNDASGSRKLTEIKNIRKEKLQSTDYMANSDYTMPDNIKTWRQSLRDIPANHTDENAYDLLLARNDAGELTHSIWSKP